MIMAAAPSFTPEALPAVIVPGVRTDGFSFARASSVVSTRDREIDLARADRLRRGADRVEARRTKAVDGDAGDRVGQPSEQERHACDVAVVLAGLVGATEIDVVEPRPVCLWMPLH